MTGTKNACFGKNGIVPPFNKAVNFFRHLPSRLCSSTGLKIKQLSYGNKVGFDYHLTS